MKSTHLQSFQAFSKKYIGRPYEDVDCWGIVKAFYSEVLDIEMKFDVTQHHLKGDKAAPLIQSNLNHAEEIPFKSCQFGDILLIRLFGIPAHLGIYLSDTQLLHTQSKMGCAIDRLSRWEKMIEGCYRIKG